MGCTVDPPVRSGRELPTGTVTFLFTGVDGGAALWERHGDTICLAARGCPDGVLGCSISGAPS
jgi:hypothetical protein